LRIGVHQRLPIPKPNVVDGPAVVLERLKGEILFRGNGFTAIWPRLLGFPRESDILPNVRRLQPQFVRLDEEALKDSGDEFQQTGTSRRTPREARAIRRRIVRSRTLAHATMAAMAARPMSSQSAGSST